MTLQERMEDWLMGGSSTFSSFHASSVPFLIALNFDEYLLVEVKDEEV